MTDDRTNHSDPLDADDAGATQRTQRQADEVVVTDVTDVTGVRETRGSITYSSGSVCRARRCAGCRQRLQC